MKKRQRKLRIKKETLRTLAGAGLQNAVGGTCQSANNSSPLDQNCDTIVDTQDSICGCAGATDTCGATNSDPGCGPSCDMQVC